jgi:long-chain acyl-CoA synthetase
MPILTRHAAERPDATAFVLHETGERVTWRALEEGSRRCAHALRALGLVTGDCIAVFMENHLRYLEILWAARRMGLYYTTLSVHAREDEIRYILEDSDACVLFTSPAMLPVAQGLTAPKLRARVLVDAPAPGFLDYAELLASAPADAPLPPTLEGTDFLYSSGTTGRPKGIRRPLEQMASQDLQRSDLWWKKFDADSVYLSTAPLYHTAPLRWNMSVLRAGGTCVLMARFDAERALQAIEQHRVTHAQFVPTMFIRLLRLPAETRERYDRRSLRVAIHAAAPCPVEVKRAMIDWWGPVVVEYYSGTEAVGRTSLTSEEWLAHPGSVGRAELGRIHITDEEGRELPAGEVGVIRFSGVPRFEYHKDPVRTQAAYDAQGRATIGDVGYVDDDCFLYLTDRSTFMIISGGVNIYPQECENLLITHPKVADAAVFGVPNEDLGEEVKAVVQPMPGVVADAAFVAELLAFCGQHLSRQKVPRSIDFSDELPRLPTGKLYKKALRDKYWGDRKTRIV